MKIFVVLMIFVVVFAGCAAPADVASRNLSTQADKFEITRRVVFYNGITGEYMLEIIGKCSLGNLDPVGEVSITCMVGNGKYVKHFLGISDNVTYFVEQIEAADASPYFYKVIFNPTTIVPDVDLVIPRSD